MSSFLRILFFAVDLLLLNLSIVVASSLHGDLSGTTSQVGTIYLLMYSNLAWLFLVMVSAPYGITKAWSVYRILKNQAAFILIHSMVIAALVVFFRREYSINQIVFIYFFFVPLFFLSKMVVYYLRKVFTTEPQYRYFVLIGRSALAHEIRKFYLLNPDLGYRFKGYVDFASGTDFPIQRIRDFCNKTEVHEIYCSAIGLDELQLKKLVNFGLDSFIRVKVVSAPRSPGMRWDEDAKLPGINTAAVPLDESLNQFVKRIFDLVFSGLFIILVMSWLVPILSIVIRLDSKGPIFFRQLRSGKDNKPFLCYKFRTMVVNAEADSKQATANDPRITKLGAFLRKTSIDELPQFLNVFAGSMSVVGPRPHMLKHTDEYSKLIETFLGRQYIKPGITGLAQSLGYRGETKDLSEMENRVRLDRYYIENWTFWLDVKIVFMTVISLLRGSEKAY